ncbi:MAG TPA: UDP-N-acetylmuramate--L-alanine ligase [Bacteroidales bacterium]|nr:UDP-N-acetylmuramate--L-alanine ligase [Bacteroidales bacterium]
MNLKDVKYVYFVGIGGIGMSALVRYFIDLGKKVAGYDKTETDLTQKLIAEGAQIHYTDDLNAIPQVFKNKQDTLVIYTPAIPKNHTELYYFTSENFTVLKRAAVLGLISKAYKTVAVAGTHGKTSISSFTAFLLSNSEVKCSAFLGGIAKNFNSNFVSNPKSELVVVEADEFDRSFLHLTPQIALVSATDADHLDIYGTKEAVVESFANFVSNVKKGGVAVLKKGIELPKPEGITSYTYALTEHADFYASDITIINGKSFFKLNTPFGNIENASIYLPGKLNIENAVAASAMALLAGMSLEELKIALPKFIGVERRFDIHVQNENILYIDDYAHHPEEIRATLSSIRTNYSNSKILAVFQPHLYTRTRDFAQEFGKSLSIADRVIVTNIYPAREEPIEGVSSLLITDSISVPNEICSLEQVLAKISSYKFDILITMGAGDISNLVKPISDFLKNNKK